MVQGEGYLQRLSGNFLSVPVFSSTCTYLESLGRDGRSTAVALRGASVVKSTLRHYLPWNRLRMQHSHHVLTCHSHKYDRLPRMCFNISKHTSSVRTTCTWLSTTSFASEALYPKDSGLGFSYMALLYFILMSRDSCAPCAWQILLMRSLIAQTPAC